MKKSVLFIVVVGIIMISCKPKMNVVSMSNSNHQIKKQGLVYSLPRTVFEIDFELKHTVFQAGPYSEYADKYLGIDNVAQSDYQYYEIVSVQVKPLAQPDPDAVFLIETDLPKANHNYRFSSQNMLHGINICHLPAIDISYPLPESFLYGSINENVWFTDLSVKRNFTNIKDTTYRVIKADSVYQKIPVINTKITSKDKEQKADEAANFIIKTRKRRFQVETGQSEYLPDGVAVETMLQSLNELENRYLELFIGKTNTSIDKIKLYYIPQKDAGNTVLFWITENGISYTKEEDAEIVSVQMQNLETTQEVSRFYKRQNELNPKNHGLYYRIPGAALMRISCNDKVYFNGMFDVAQYGYCNFIDVAVMRKKDFSVELDPLTGAIRFIK